MPDEDNKILKENYGEKSLKAPFMISAELECLPKKYSHVKIILKNLIQQKKTKHAPSGYSLFHCLQIVHLTRQKNKLDCYKR